MKCEGCKEEMRECYRLQQLGYDAGLEFVNDYKRYGKGEHCFVFAFDKKGRLIVW